MLISSRGIAILHVHLPVSKYETLESIVLLVVYAWMHVQY